MYKQRYLGDAYYSTKVQKKVWRHTVLVLCNVLAAGSKVHIWIYIMGLNYQHAKIADSSSLFKANWKTVTVHLYIGMRPTVYILLNCIRSIGLNFWCFQVFICIYFYLVFNFIRFNKAYIRCSGWDVIILLFAFFVCKFISFRGTVL